MDDPTQDTADKPQWTKTQGLVYLILYTVEMCLKILGLGFVLNHGAYLSDGWNILDFIIVVSGYSEIVFSGSGVSLSALRTLRVLRPQRTISSVKNLKTIIITIFNAIPYLTEVLVVVQFVFLVFAIAGLQLFGGLQKRRCFDEATGVTYAYGFGEILCNGTDNCPGGYICGKQLSNPDYGVTSFDNFGEAFLMVFQVTTMEGWTLIMVQIQRVFTDLAILYFILLVFIGNFFLLNLLLAVIIVKFTEAQNEQKLDEELEMNMLYHEINLIFPVYRPQYKKNCYLEGIPLARMKIRQDERALNLSSIEIARENIRRLEDQIQIINFFLKNHNKPLKEKDELFNKSQNHGDLSKLAIKNNKSGSSKDPNSHVAFNLKNEVGDNKSQTIEDNLLRNFPQKNSELAKVSPGNLENLKLEDNNKDSANKKPSLHDSNSKQQKGNTKNSTISGKNFWESLFKPGDKFNLKDTDGNDILNYSYDELKTMEKSKLEELANTQDQQKNISGDGEQRYGPHASKFSKAKTTKTTNSDKMNQTNNLIDKNNDIDSDDPDEQIKNKPKKIEVITEKPLVDDNKNSNSPGKK